MKPFTILNSYFATFVYWTIFLSLATTPTFAERPDLRNLRAGDIIPNHYIVSFKRHVNANSAFQDVIKTHQIAEQRIGYQFGVTLNGFSARLSPLEVERLRGDSRIASLEPDRVVKVRQNEASASWGLDRIDQHALPLDSTYHYEYSGNGVTAYIIDTGIRYTHQEFGGRASFGFDAFGESGVDCFGHGTHVAGTIGGRTYGVAKSVHLVGVRVLDCTGSGSTSGVIAGIDWVAAHHAPASVANLSLGGPASPALDTAIRNMIAAGVTTAVAAGNENTDACNTSPARVSEAITVGATSKTDARASFSNFGNCVDLFAPGEDITSAWKNSDTSVVTISGTSMATPHVAGVAALYLEHYSSATPKEVRDALVNYSTQGTVTDARSLGNGLLYSLELSGPSPSPSPSPTPTPTPPTDTEAPRVKILQPTNGSFVLAGRSARISALTADNVGVKRIDFLANNTLICSTNGVNQKCDWKVPRMRGIAIIRVNAYDAAGNRGTAQVSVRVW